MAIMAREIQQTLPHGNRPPRPWKRHSITGYDFRVLVINYKFICAALRTPASVTGDGEHTIQWLVDETNKDPRRGYGHEKVLTQITIDQFTQKMLDEKGYSLETIPEKDEIVLLKPTANLSTGGT